MAFISLISSDCFVAALLAMTYLQTFYKIINLDEFVKSLKMGYSVIPVKTGIQSFQYLGRFWIPACAGMTTFYETINLDDFVKSQIDRHPGESRGSERLEITGFRLSPE